MNISKRECMKFDNPGYIIEKNSGLLLLEDVLYIVRAAVRNISHRHVLILYFYNRKKAAQAK